MLLLAPPLVSGSATDVWAATDAETRLIRLGEFETSKRTARGHVPRCVPLPLPDSQPHLAASVCLAFSSPAAPPVSFPPR
jgi:hypothetical protein